MPKTKKWLLNLFLIISTLFCIVSIFSCIFIYNYNKNLGLVVLPLLGFVLGITAFILNFCTIKRAYIVFASVLLCFCSLWLFVLITDIVKGSIMNWWPILGVFSGISLFASGYYKYKKVRYGYLIPAAALLVIGFWFLCFSWNIISVPFVQVAIIGGPLLLLMGFVLLFVLFYFQQKDKRFIAHDDDSNQFEDDDIVTRR